MFSKHRNILKASIIEWIYQKTQVIGKSRILEPSLRVLWPLVHSRGSYHETVAKSKFPELPRTYLAWRVQTKKESIFIT